MLSDDLKRVRWGSRKQDLFDNPERFDWEPFVLGHERFSSGRHWWVVEVEEMESGPSAMETTQESVRRKIETGLNPEEGRDRETEEKMAAKWAMWAVGVARESVVRKGKVNLNPNGGIWALGKAPLDSLRTPLSSYQVTAFTSPERTPVGLRHEIQKIQVSLDYEKGHVEFFDADTNDSIATFSPASFSGERIRPFFWVYWGVRLSC
ncbi:tripartite motif-containing protein 26-like [Sceloporus undulatus]|uniref:tripartite motif-containing protein 26-like n=1 Tax=Sceloporus undulatus TaxID=8520 RepID=UPI001C4D2C51|nr:tripartite motif-containing protein 26-like [Sceloporus undulatus]